VNGAPIVHAEDLQAVQCARCPPGTSCDDQVFLVQRCHPRRGLSVAFNKQTKQVEVSCRICKRPVANVAVAGHSDK
jgi:hypothetical protein